VKEFEILFKVEEDEIFNLRNILNISMIKISADHGIGQKIVFLSQPQWLGFPKLLGSE
jgi:hypothetical protein